MAAVLFSLSFLIVAQTNQPDLVRALQSGTFQEREGALQQILEIPPGERSEPVWLALVGELQQERALQDQRCCGLSHAWTRCCLIRVEPGTLDRALNLWNQA
jgi:hypothetical protein